MAIPVSPGALARACAKRPWTTIGVWAVAFAVFAGIAAAFLGGVLTTKFDFTNDPESRRADTLLAERLRGPVPVNEILIVRSATSTVDDPVFRQTVDAVYASVAGLGPDVIASGFTYYQTGAPSMVSKDRKATIIPIVMTGDLDKAGGNLDAFHASFEGVKVPDGFEVLDAGVATINRDFKEIAEQDLKRAETIGGVIALIILILVFGAVVAAIVPVVLAVVSIVIALGLTALVGQVFDLSFFVTNMITMIGLAVGIDYSLFILQRYREERARGLDKIAAIGHAGSTASRAVLFSGITVMLALMGMLLIPANIYRSLGIGAILVVLVTVLASLTLLPAVLGLMGDHVNRLGVPFLRNGQANPDDGRPGGFWDRLSRTVMRRPIVSIVLVTAILASAAIPYFSMQTGFAGVETFPDDRPTKKAFSVLQQDFSAGLVAPVDVVIEGPINSPAVQQAIGRLAAAVKADSAFGPASPLQVNAKNDLALFSFPLIHQASPRAAADEARRVRRDLVAPAFVGAPATALVTGDGARNLDFFDLADRSAVPVFAFVLTMSFILLTLAFRSIIVPLKAVILNLLSVGAAYGVLVLVFQKGVGHRLFGFQQVPAIEAWLPLFLFSVLFGLSMDYHVFLISRIRERYDQTGDNVGSVAFGIRSTGRLITGAALIMVAVFAGFANGSMVMLQETGFGLAVAVLLDATIVRIVLVPAGMKLLGRANWYLPFWLKWLPDLRVEPARAAAPAHPAAAGLNPKPGGAP